MHATPDAPLELVELTEDEQDVLQQLGHRAQTIGELADLTFDSDQPVSSAERTVLIGVLSAACWRVAADNGAAVVDVLPSLNSEQAGDSVRDLLAEQGFVPAAELSGLATMMLSSLGLSAEAIRLSRFRQA